MNVVNIHLVPTEETEVDFWRMVWEKKINRIVLLTHNMVKNKQFSWRSLRLVIMMILNLYLIYYGFRNISINTGQKMKTKIVGK